MGVAYGHRRCQLVKCSKCFKMLLIIALFLWPGLSMGGFIVGQERQMECSGSVTMAQTGKPDMKLFGSSKNLKLERNKPIRIQIEGNCCWTLHAKKRFKGFKTFLAKQGDHKIPSKLIRSVSRTECHLIPSLPLGGLGWPGVGLLVILVGVVFLVKERLMKKIVKIDSEGLEIDEVHSIVSTNH